ncbi:MAG: DNA-3-methyladenine glycosylase [Gammaproteobacteria bacterium]
MLKDDFFDDDTIAVAQRLLGKILCVKHQQQWLMARIIETEAYYINDKSSHASLGFTEKRKGLFMAPGTIYMYYSRAGDSLNISTRGEGNAVLIKSGYPYLNHPDEKAMIATMQALNPPHNNKGVRPIEKLCGGQTLLCRSLGLKVKTWDQKNFSKNTFFIKDVGEQPHYIYQTQRLGINPERDSHLPYRFIHGDYGQYCTKKPPKTAKKI